MGSFLMFSLTVVSAGIIVSLVDTLLHGFVLPGEPYRPKQGRIVLLTIVLAVFMYSNLVAEQP